MLKKVILTVTVLFLLFEVLYFDSNNQLNNIKNNASKFVYQIEINNNEKDQFLDEYSNIILENDNDKITFLTDEKVFNEIKDKYNFTVE